MKRCDLPAILERAAYAARMVDVQDSASVTICADDAYKIGDVVRDCVPAMALEIEEWRNAVTDVVDADIAGDKDAIFASIARLRSML